MKYQARRRADLSGRMLRGEDLRGVDWRDAKLVGADLSGALLNGADLSNADLTGALLVGVDLYGATLFGAVLRDADLRNAKIRAVVLNNADLTGADLSDAQLNRGGRGGRNNPRRPTALGANLVRADCAERIAAIPPQTPPWGSRGRPSCRRDQMIRTVRPKYACHHCEADQPYRAGTAGWLLYRYRTYVEGCECNERHQQHQPHSSYA